MRLRNGQTLLELLVAFTVIAVGLFAAVTLVFSNLNAVQRDSDEVVSVNLAREGLELSKRLRDSNWLAGNNFDTGMDSAGDYTATPVWAGAPIPGTPTFDFAANDLTHANTDVVKTAGSVFANYFPPAITGAATPFKRLVTFNPICFDDSVLPGTISIPVPAAPCLAPKRKVGVRVESHVTWTRKGVTRDSIITEDLYDWR